MNKIDLNRQNGQKLWAADWNQLISTINLIINVINALDSLPEITKLSQLTNDTGFITETDISGKANKSELAQVATSGSYNDLIDKPQVIGELGKSAYLVAVDAGFIGTPADWLLSLKGDPGNDGLNGQDGNDGKSAYEIAVELGYDGTLELWLNSLHGLDGSDGNDGSNGSDGKSAYLSYVDTTSDNPVLTELLWIASLHGQDGLNGTNGIDGITPHIDSTSKHWMVGSTDTGIVAEGSGVQSDWNESDNSSLAYIANKPTIPTIPSNETATLGGSTLSVVTTGDKYNWNNKANIWTGTQVLYDALSPDYDSNTVYIITTAS